tara:strand:- start:219 stop:443 length:225 start_codon:yes stop_codon:yes gene_type:complete
MTAVEQFWKDVQDILPSSVDTETGIKLVRAYDKAKAMEKQREKSIFSIAYRMIPTEFGKEHCEAEFEKFIQPNL